MKVGIVGGTGFAAAIADAHEILVDTPWGSVPVHHRHDGGTDLFFLQRHGPSALPPHRIPNRANVEALARCGVDAILALNAVGAVDPTIAVPSLVVPDDLLDLRKTTETFHDARAVHVDMTQPYCPHLRGLLVADAGAKDGATYAALEGPRLETPAEIRMLRTLGAHLVGMTGAPEAALARERALCYASLCLVVNAAAGVRPEPLRADELKRGAEALAPRALAAVLATAREVGEKRACRCREALEGARL